MSEEALIKLTVNMTTVSTEGTVPKKEEIPMAINTSMGGFFVGADIIAEAMASATVAASKEVSAKSLVPPSKPISIEEDNSIEEKVIGESAPIFIDFSTPSKGGVSPMAA